MSGRAGKLLAEIERSRAVFQAEWQARAEWLAYRAQFYPALGAADAAQITRLAVHYRQSRRRYERRFGKPAVRPEFPKIEGEGRWKAHPHYSSYRKALVALREFPELAGAVALDEASGKIMLKAPMPLAFWDHGKAFPIRRMNGDDIASLAEYLQSLGLTDLSRDDCLAAVRVIARENAWRADGDG